MLENLEESIHAASKCTLWAQVAHTSLQEEIFPDKARKEQAFCNLAHNNREKITSWHLCLDTKAPKKKKSVQYFSFL